LRGSCQLFTGGGGESGKTKKWGGGSRGESVTENAKRGFLNINEDRTTPWGGKPKERRQKRWHWLKRRKTRG